MLFKVAKFRVHIAGKYEMSLIEFCSIVSARNIRNG
jgi:hypothetical protein